MNCPVCKQARQTATDRFCAGCGAEFAAMAAPAPNKLERQLPLLLTSFACLLLGVVVAQNFYLVGRFNKLLNDVTVAAAPYDSSMGGGMGAPAMSGAPSSNEVTAESPDSAMVFAALMTPCGRCNKLLADNNCSHPHGAIETKRLINQMFKEGKSKHEVVGYFVGKYGEKILSPQALAIYKQKNRPQGGNKL